MKKKLLSLFLCLLLSVSALTPPASAAASAFPDIADGETASAVEVLRLMGVLGGYSDGTFRPDATLNRAQFCKMVVQAVGAEKELGRYKTVTVFPDVKPSHWAAAYVNLAARGKKIVAGYADGSFHPEREVTLGHAVTILLRLLGYKDEDIGGVWPDGYVSAADSIGLLDGVGTAGRENLSRAQAAKLFRNLLRAETASGGNLYTLSEETVLTSIDGGAGKLVTEDHTYDMEYPQPFTTLTGSRGQVVLREGKALTFLPAKAGGTAVPDAAVIVTANGSTQGFQSLTGGRTDYAIYKNGLNAVSGDLRLYDVATYSAATNAILVCDTRVTAQYEDCSPSPANPSTVEILGGTELRVLPTAVDSLSRFRPGQVLTFLLSADGQVAGVVDNKSGLRGNAVAVAGEGGTVLLCGTAEVKVNCSLPDSVGVAAWVSANEDGEIQFNRLTKSVSGDLNLRERTMGAAKLADNVRVYDADGLTSLDELDLGVVPAADVTGSRANWAGDVDLIVLHGDPAAQLYFGRAEFRQEQIAIIDRNGVNPRESGWIPTYTESQPYMTVRCGNGRTIGPLLSTFIVDDGAYVAVRLNRAGTAYAGVWTLRRLDQVSVSSWIGKSAVSFGGRTYTVAADAVCYNRDNGRWMTLEQALEYADRANVYIYDDVVRILEVQTQPAGT